MEWLIGAIVAILVFGGKAAVQEVKQIVNKNDFYNAFKEAAKGVDWGGIDPAMALAQADLESGSGSGHIFQVTKNLFSLTVGSGSKPSDVTLLPPYTVQNSGLQFRNYKSMQDAIKDWIFHMHLPIYSKALAALLSKNFNQFAIEVKKAGYDASSSTYTADLIERYSNVRGVVV